MGAAWLLSIRRGCSDFTIILLVRVWGIGSSKAGPSSPFPGRPRSPPCLLIASRPQDWPGCGAPPSPDLGGVGGGHPSPRRALLVIHSPVRAGSSRPGAAPSSSESPAEHTELCNAAEPTFTSRSQFAGLELHCADALRYGWLLSRRP